ncbi:MAG: PLP-dependent transferase, partial [Sphingobacteriales bacterium]|nr:PLP-dependent transferase [Sphingobacteriales bacterium]
MNEKLHFETQAIQSTLVKDAQASSVTQPIYLTTTFERETDGSYAHGFVYSRLDNPNRKQLEASVALLENGDRAFAFASGMASINTMYQTLKTGDHVIIPDDAYYATEILLRDVYQRWGLQMTKVDMSNNEAVQKAVQSNTKMIWAETPSNPLLKVSDIESIAAIAHKA